MTLPRTYLQSVLDNAKSPALFLSFGKDSLLLYHLAKEVRRDLTLYTFGDTLSSFAEQFIMDNDLMVIRYAPADRYLVPNGDGLALVDEFALNDIRVPLVHPIVRGADCAHGVSTKRTPQFRFPHDVVLYGYKSGETCDAIGTTFPKEMMIGGSKFVAPLYELTDFDVYEALETLGVDPPMPDNELEFCDECLNAVIASDWDKNAALAGFRSRFQFNH